MRFAITFLKQDKVIAVIRTHKDTDIKVSELQKIIETEEFLERLTGYRVHIEESN